MTIGGYRFDRVDDYAERLQRLQHTVTFHSEFPIEAGTGAHQVTARVTLPQPEPLAILPWSGPKATALDDLTLLLSIFTGRQVFVLRGDEAERRPQVLTADPRQTLWGGVVQLSIPYEKSPPQDERDPYSTGDDGLQVHLNRVYERMGTDDWREKYRSGYYLLLFRTALLERTIESAFIQCWTIWEHLFSILNDSWMTRESIGKATSTDKIAFLLVNFAVRERLQDNEKGRLQSLALIRNRLIHFGQFPVRSRVYDDSLLFIRMTEWIVASTLGLKPSEAFDTLAQFEEFVAGAAGTA
jgi:hypothetical protein